MSVFLCSTDELAGGLALAGCRANPTLLIPLSCRAPQAPVKIIRSKAHNKVLKVWMRIFRAHASTFTTGTASVPGGSFVLSDLQPESLMYARHARGSRISLRFSDGLAVTLDLATLGIDTSELRLATAHPSSWGSAVEVEDQRGKTVHIDSAVLRSYCDPKYAAELRQAIADLAVEHPTTDNATRLGNMLAELDSLKDLQDGWNSYSAPAPYSVAIENAKAMVIEAYKLGTDPERVEPSAMGGVGVTFWAGNNREAAIEFYNDGTAHALLSDDATGDMHTQAVPTDRDEYRGIISEIRKYLYGEEQTAR